MIPALAITTIFVISGGAWLANKFLPFKICPICAGVSGTWLWLLTARIYGYPIDPLLPAILMGGSVVGISYSAESRLRAGRSALLWKTFFIPAGFLTVYGAVSGRWSMFAAAAFMSALIAFFFFRAPASVQTDAQVSGEIEGKLKECC